jgi:hypothetical protein
MLNRPPLASSGLWTWWAYPKSSDRPTALSLSRLGGRCVGVQFGQPLG